MIKFIKRRAYKFSKALFKRLGYQLLSFNQVENLAGFTFNILEAAIDKTTLSKIDSIVFSKDRAMQLHAFLLSYKEQVSNRGRMYIIYKYSNQRHKKSYEELRQMFIDEDFIFIEELDFRNQLIELLERSDAGKIIFYVDDMIFTHPIDYKVLGGIDTAKYILALSRGKDMNYSVVLQKRLVLPKFTNIGNNLERFNWDYLKEYSDWTYPLGVSGYMYGRIEIYSMLKAIDFKAPNSLESQMQLFLLYFNNRYGLCTEFATCVCVHVNLVQTEGKNPILGTFSIDQLLDLWENGERIDIREFYNKPMSVTQIQKYQFVRLQGI